MKLGIILLLFVGLLLLSGCLEQPTDKIGILTTTTLLKTSTSLFITTSISATTSLKEKSDLEKCQEKEIKSERDHCYLNLAMNTHDSSICNSIESTSTKKLCLGETKIETSGKSTTLQGYVMYAKTSHIISGIKVRAISQTFNEEIARDTTNKQGFYSMKVPSRDTYTLLAKINDKEYKYEIYAKTGFTHEIWFKV